jgi:curved DNA-binding protein CbpA
MDLSKDYYEILGVSPTIEPETLKAVFKALSKKYHPDTTAKASTSKRFQDIQEAFDVLTNPHYVKSMIEEN